MNAVRPIRLAPSVLDADFGHLAAQIATVEAAGADLLHMDVMDGHFVPNLSIGVPVVRGVARCTRLPLDTHLMISEPGRYAKPFAEAGSRSITFHIEVVDNAPAMVRLIRALGVQVGVALNPGTPAEAVQAILPEVDLVLVMTVWPGFGGQKFIDDCLPKIRALAAQLGPHQALEVDGGLNVSTIGRAVAAGADTIVAGSAVFGSGDPAAALRQLRAAALSAQRASVEPAA